LNFSSCLEICFCVKVHFTFHIVSCLLLNFILFFAYILKLFKGPLRHRFLLYFEKHATFSRACGSRVVHQLKQNNAKISAKVSKRGPATCLKNGAPRRQPCSPSPISTPALNYTQKKERTVFIL